MSTDNTEIENEVRDLERENENLRERVAKGELAKKVLENKDFKAFILDYFCTQECARYAQASCDVKLDEESRADALGYAQSAGYLKRFLDNTVTLGHQAVQSIRSNEDEIIRLRTGDNE